MSPVRVLIADDQHLFAESLRYVLAGEAVGRVEVCGIAANGEEAIDMVAKLTPDVVLMDIRMPVMDGVKATEVIHTSEYSTKVIILTTFDDDELAVAALSSGASGYVLKDVDPEDLIQCIEAVHRGAFYISSSVGTRIFDSTTGNTPEAKTSLARAIDSFHRAMPNVTHRECEILYYVAQAMSNQQIADLLFISEKTVKNHIGAIYSKLNIHSRLELIHYILSVSGAPPQD